jgi:DNA-binding NtrC family response regulator
MLMLDRYLVAGGRALDLATGASIRWHVRRQPVKPGPALFAVRAHAWLIDFDLRGRSRIEVWERPASGGFPEAARSDALDTFRAALADARDGRPRALDLAEPTTEAWARTHRLLAREARLAGFVPIAADALGAVLSQARWRWPSWLRDRSLVVFATDSRLPNDAALALFRLATKDARPHLIVRTATGDRPWRRRLMPAPLHVHEPGAVEAAAAVDAPAGLIERSRQLRISGQILDAEAAARWGLLLANDIDQSAAKCALARCLVEQHRLLEARAALLAVETAEADELRAQIARDTSEPRTEPAMVRAFLDLLRVCQEIEDGSLALSRACGLIREQLSAACVAFVSRDRDRAHVVTHVGSMPPAAGQLDIALRVLDTGVAVAPADAGHSAEAAWPVRYGSAVVGAVWCRWATGVPVVPQDIATLLGLAATAAAPAMHEVVERLRTPPVSAGLIPDLVGDSPGMQAVRQAVLRAAASPFPVLIEGESGSGKELVARAVHAASVRRGRKFCALNCAAIADDLVEAELFGHTRGAFTGAVAERVGLFEEAQGGTLFLDEVAELSSRVQAKLLRTLQESEVRRLGESSTRKIDSRIVAATNRPLAGEVEQGRFRGDLRYRLDVLRIAIPPLRDRIEDLPALVRHGWAELARRTGSRAVLSPGAFGLLASYDWPGNVRELQNVLASVMVAGPARGVIGPQTLPAHITRAAAMGNRSTLAEARRVFETHYVRAALARAGGRTLAAARELGVSRQGLTKLIARLQLEPPKFKV